MPVKKIVLIGAGNVATNLGIALKKAGFSIIQVYSQTIQSAGRLGDTLKCPCTNSLNNIDRNADLYILSIKDDAIVQLLTKVHLANKIIVHTSGSVEMNVLKESSNNFGIIYPLQTFSKNKIVSFKNIPILIEANTPKVRTVLKAIAKKLSTEVVYTNSETRKNIHLAAVFACNFSNHMYTVAYELLKEKNISLHILQPLIEETASKIKNIKPAIAQTGPAIRGDKKLMQQHLKMLDHKKEYRKIYSLISKSIQKIG